MTTALIVVDVQNDFAHPDGNLYVPHGEFVANKVNEMLDDYYCVIYTKDFHPAETSHFNEYGGPWPKHCVENTWGSEFHEDLTIVPDAPVIYKGTNPGEDGYSAFSVESSSGWKHPTELDDYLATHNIAAVDIVGIALDVCVKATALDALELGYHTTVILSATAPVTAKGGEEALEEMQAKGVVIA